MSMTQGQPSRSAAAQLSAKPAVGATAGTVQFDVVARGYDKRQVEEWGHRAMTEIERLTSQVTSFVGREIQTPEGRKLMVEVLQVIADEATGQQQAAEVQIEQMISGAREQAGQIIDDARRQANDTTASATQQAASLVEGARVDAKHTRDQADAYSVAVHETAGARLQQIARIHRDTLDRVAQIQAVTADTMAAEQSRGPIEDEVTRALAPLTQVSPR